MGYVCANVLEGVVLGEIALFTANIIGFGVAAYKPDDFRAFYFYVGTWKWRHTIGRNTDRKREREREMMES